MRQNTRNKIVFCRSRMQGLQYVDVGFALSLRLKTNENNSSVIDIVSQILNENIRYDEDFGYYLSIENIGILFEPELKLDVRSMIDSYSKNQCLVVLTDADIDNGVLYFLEKSDGVSVSLSGLSFKELK
ncbi:MAG: hypothetical protein ACI4TD_10555 [Phocaeicola sp.]